MKERRAKLITWGISILAIVISAGVTLWLSMQRPKITITETGRVPFNVLVVASGSTTVSGTNTTTGSNTVPVLGVVTPTLAQMSATSAPLPPNLATGDIILFQIKNTGVKDITISDFDEPIRAVATDGERIITYTDPPNANNMLSGTLERLSESAIRLKPMLLNAGDSFNVNAFVTTNKGLYSHPTVNWYGHIKGMKALQIIDSSNAIGQQNFTVQILYQNWQVGLLCGFGIVATLVLFLLFGKRLHSTPFVLALKCTTLAMLGFATGEVIASIFVTGVRGMNWIYCAPVAILYAILVLGKIANIIVKKLRQPKYVVTH